MLIPYPLLRQNIDICTWYFLQFLLINGDATLELKLISFTNPGGLDSSNKECDVVGKCDYVLKFCVEPQRNR